MPNTHQNQLSEFGIRYGFHSWKYCPSLCSKTVQIDAPPIFLPSPIHSRISPRETGHPGPDGPPVERPGGYWIRSFRCATERVSTTKGGSLPFPGAGGANPPFLLQVAFRLERTGACSSSHGCFLSQTRLSRKFGLPCFVAERRENLLHQEQKLTIYGVWTREISRKRFSFRCSCLTPDC